MKVTVEQSLKRIVIESEEELTAKDLRGIAWGAELAAAGIPISQETPLQIVRPSAHRLPDSFYAVIATAYVEAVALHRKPRKDIAALARVSSDVAGRWISEARKRGFLGPTTPGTVRA